MFLFSPSVIAIACLKISMKRNFDLDLFVEMRDTLQRIGVDQEQERRIEQCEKRVWEAKESKRPSDKDMREYDKRVLKFHESVRTYMAQVEMNREKRARIPEEFLSEEEMPLRRTVSSDGFNVPQLPDARARKRKREGSLLEAEMSNEIKRLKIKEDQN